MKNVTDPKQEWLFDPVASRFSPVAMHRLAEDWPGFFRACILELMPVEEVGFEFSQVMGRPTKELHSACGLLLLMEFNDWTVEQAADAYMFDSRVQFALNLGLDCNSMSTRTVERYQVIFRKNKLAQEMMDRVTRRLVELLEVEVDRLRLDSTHVFSDMATFGRTRLMMTVTRRFMIQLKRHDSKSYHGLDLEFRERYDKRNWEFGKKGGSIPSRDDVAKDMHFLIGTYENDERIASRTSFKDLVRVFGEQCELVGDKITVRKKTGAGTLQNPSDPDATYDAHKGPGYQVQVTETCSDENETQLIVDAIPETACEPDAHAVKKVLDNLDGASIEPTSIVADTAYGGDTNCTTCQEKGIELVAPVLQGSMKKGRVELHEFEIDESGCIRRCPEGCASIRSWFDDEKKRGGAVFAKKTCESCPRLELCQVRKNGKNFYAYYDDRALRIVKRKRRMRSSEGREIYAKRSGIEALFSAAKRTTGLDRLRVRGRSSVFHSILLKVVGVNIMRAAKNQKIRDIVARILAKITTFGTKSRSLLSFCHTASHSERFEATMQSCWNKSTPRGVMAL